MFEMIYRTGATNNQPQVQIQIHHQHWSPTPPAKFGEFGWIERSDGEMTQYTIYINLGTCPAIFALILPPSLEGGQFKL